MTSGRPDLARRLAAETLGTFCLADADAMQATAPPAPFPAEAVERYALWKWTLNNCGCQTSRGLPLRQNSHAPHQ